MINQTTLKDVLNYDPETGDFTWRKKISIKVVIGAVAGTVGKHGGKLYRRICIFGVRYYAHQLAWLYVHGQFVDLIDHDDLDGTNNAIRNLRPASHSQNHANQGRSVNNITGFKGVQFFRRDGTYMAQITVRRRKIFLGYFDTPEEAHAAYVKASSEHFGEFARAA